jgi:hypothetical protein
LLIKSFLRGSSQYAFIGALRHYNTYLLFVFFAGNLKLAKDMALARECLTNACVNTKGEGAQSAG